MPTKSHTREVRQAGAHKGASQFYKKLGIAAVAIPAALLMWRGATTTFTYDSAGRLACKIVEQPSAGWYCATDFNVLTDSLAAELIQHPEACTRIDIQHANQAARERQQMIAACAANISYRRDTIRWLGEPTPEPPSDKPSTGETPPVAP